LSPDVVPSTAPDEYDNPNDGVAPVTDAATGRGYEYWNDPEPKPTDHDPAAPNGVAE
jgi:hypothetical protein